MHPTAGAGVVESACGDHADSGVPASTFPPAARAAFRTLSPFFSPTHFHEEPNF